jgi:hypothetical protein
MFTTQKGGSLFLYILGALVVSALVIVALTLTPSRFRKPLIAAITFLAGLFYAVEFFWPVATTGPNEGKNFLTPFMQPLSDAATVLQSFALGLGVYSLVTVHLRNAARRKTNWGFSVLLLGAILAMLIPSLLKTEHPNRYNTGVHALVFRGAYTNLNATMFSIVAFYIVSAAYRAFRIRSIESTVLLLSAFIIMMGQVALGQALTAWIPNEGFAANFRVENFANWISTKVNSPAILAVDFGLGIGSLATSLRLWLSLERGSYFDQEL